MNSHFSRLAPAAAALFAGFLFISWGGSAGWRTLQNGMLLYPGFQAFEKAPSFKAPAKNAANRLAPAQKVELSRRLGAAVKDPSSISSADLAAVNKTWGKDAAKMLSMLKDSSR
jgi:hypothetical protein